MERYRQYGYRDDRPINDGDQVFNGFSSRVQPVSLPAGMLAYSQNGRMDRGTWRMRNGAKSLSTSVILPTGALLVDGFSLTADIVISSLQYINGLAYIDTATPHGFTNLQMVYVHFNGNETLNGDVVITVDSPTQFHYAQNVSRSDVAGVGIAGRYCNGGPLLLDSLPVLASCTYANTIDNSEGIVIVGPISAYLYRDGIGFMALNYPFHEYCDPNQSIDAIQFLNKIYIFRGYGSLDVMPSNVYTSGSNVMTVNTAPTPHGLTQGDWVNISDSGSRMTEGVFNAVSISNAFEFVVYSTPHNFPVGINYSAKVRKAQPALVWDLNLNKPYFTFVPTENSPLGANYIHIPPVNWGAYYKSRLILPLSKDEIILSDILDPDTYDLSYSQFRTLPGSADWLIAIAPFQEDKFLVLYRKSVHVIQLSDTLAISSNVEVTRAFGCVARKTAIDCGQYLLWLSDIGIMRMNVSDFITLKSDTRPLSDAIQDIIDTINWTYADRAVGKYWNNRAFFAIPTGSSTVNNTIIVYNFLNEAWESKDVYPAGFDVIGLHSIEYSGRQRLHAVTNNGFLYLLDEVSANDEIWANNALSTQAIDASMTTRAYLAGTYDVKTIKRVQVEASGLLGGVVTTQALLSNPDIATTPEIFTRTVGNPDVSLRNSINKRGSAIQMKISTTGASSDIKAIGIEGRVSAHSTIDRE